MGEVVKFRAKRLSGFLPDDLGEDKPRQRPIKPLVQFAKEGGPIIPDNEPA